MNQKRVLGETAAARFQQGYNCAQSVLLTMFEHWKGKSELIPRIATPFGSGIGRCGSVCGALTGGLMALGIKYGTNKPSSKERSKAYGLAQTLYKKFEKQNGSVLCYDLIGYDLSNSEDARRAREAKVFDEKCVSIVRKAVEALVEISENQE
jgi:C_GCAxxG_C_C family probable redox protein